MGVGGSMGAMSDFDIAYGIVAVDKTAAGINGAIGNTQAGTKSIAEQFFFMSAAVNQAIAYINQGFDATVGAALKWADQLKKASDVTGMTTEDLQRLKAAGLATGVSFDSIVTAARMMTQKIGEGGTAGAELRDRLKELGVETIKSNGAMRSSSEIFWDTIEALSKIDDPMTRNSLAMKTLGRGWAELAPMIREYQNAASAAAGATIVSEEEIERAHDMGIRIDQLNAKLGKTGRNIGMELLPATEEWMDLISSGLSGDSPLVGFFGWLDGVLIRSAQGFNIIGQTSKAAFQNMTGDFAGAKKTMQDLSSWITEENRKQGLRESGYFEGAVWINGKWTDPESLKAKTESKFDTGEEGAEKESDRVTALTDAYKAEQEAVKKLADEKNKLYDSDRDYYEGILEAGGDYSKIRSLTSAHKKSERTSMATIAEDQQAASDAATRFNEIKAGTPLAQVKGTSQYTTAQAQTTNSLSIGTVNLDSKYKFDDFLKDYEKYLSQQRNLKAVKSLQ
jgi:hypothetical protein